MPTALITGANRGLGLEFVRQYQADGWEVIATARRSSPELDASGAMVRQLDMSDPEAVANFQTDGPLDLLIANAGIYGPAEARSADDGRAWQEVLTVNCIAPTLLARALLRNVAATKGKLIAVSSRMGSIADSSTGSIAYRSSKAALNMAWHVLALETKADGIIAATLNPGWVKTDMGGSGAPLSPPDSVAGMREVIAKLTPAQSGGFYDRTGDALPW
uniref:SDR family oxidoreductase n=1 Tax=uncultured Sphingomonas sp. TaxID=158754 RepID=UPI0025EFD243|nr:SDR family oxidoreductase [uncultured Sphingomonas sp.]